MCLPHRRQFLHLATGAAALPAVSRFAWAQAYPTRPVRWIVGFPPGGGAEVVVRTMGNWLSERLGQPVIIENRPGGGTNIAVQAVVNSAPDGYTLLFFGSANAYSGALYDKLSFDFLRDIAPIAGLVEYPILLVAHPSFPARTTAEFIDDAKANPGKINMASFGTGTTSHIAGELLRMMTGINVVHVPYRGSAPMLTDLLGGQVQVAIDTITTSLPHVRSGALRALGVAGKARIPMLPEVPIIGETVPGYEASIWSGIGVRAGTPPAIIERLNREINEGLADSSIKARFAELGNAPIVFTSSEFLSYAKAEAEKWSKVIRAANIKLD